MILKGCVQLVLFAVLLPKTVSCEENDNSSKQCFCHFQSSIGQLTCSKKDHLANDILSRPANWCGETESTFADVVQLHIVESRLCTNFSFNTLNGFVNLRRLTFHRNNFTAGRLMLNQPIPSFMSNLEELDLSSNSLNSIQPLIMNSLPSLTTLNLNENNLSTLERDLFVNNSLLNQLHIRDNPWSCTDIEWLLDWLASNASVSVDEKQRISCSYHERNTIFGSTTFANLLDECPESCVCRMARSMVKVDCSNRNLTTFPPLIPEHTGILHLENNHIDSLGSLINGTNYLNLRFLYLDNNSIDSLSILESTNLFDGLFAFHLSGNRLRQLPTHVFDRLFLRYLDQVKLGGNPWNCDCESISSFYNLLARFRNAPRFKDIDEIRCASDSSHPNWPIYKFRTSEFCVPSNAYKFVPLDLVNAVLIILILGILAKVLYDYLRMQRTGKGPGFPFNCRLPEDCCLKF